MLAVLLAVFVAGRVLSSLTRAPGSFTTSKLHFLCRGPEGPTTVLFHHAEHGSALQFVAAMDEIAAVAGLRSCSFDRPGFGFSSPEASEEDVSEFASDASVQVGHSIGALYALKQQSRPKKGEQRFVLLDALVGGGAFSEQDWSEFRNYINRPVDNDHVFVTTGFARVLRVLRFWQPWHGTQLAEWDLQVLPSHMAKIRSMYLGDMFQILRNNSRLPPLAKKSQVELIFASDPSPASAVAVEAEKMRKVLRPRVRAEFVSRYEEDQVHVTTLDHCSHNGLVTDDRVIARIIKRKN